MKKKIQDIIIGAQLGGYTSEQATQQVLDLFAVSNMDKQTIIDKFLEKNDLKEYELVYWKHKCSHGFELKKFMGDFIDYYNEQLKTPAVVWQSGQAGFCMHNLDMKGKCFKCEEQYIQKEG